MIMRETILTDIFNAKNDKIDSNNNMNNRI